MNCKSIEGLEKKVSQLVFGTATSKLSKAAAPGAAQADTDAAYELLDEVLKNGVNTFDCAAIYGEEVLGSWMENRQVRDKCVVLTKCSHPNKWRDRVTDYDILSDVHDSLAKLKTDCIDILVLHRDSSKVPVGVIIDTLNRLYQQGKVKIFGGSNWTCERIEEANDYALCHKLEPLRVSSPNFSLAEQLCDPWRSVAKWSDECVTISGKEHENDRKWYEKTKMPVFAYSSMARGWFSGRFTSENASTDASKIMDSAGIAAYYCPENTERLRRCEELALEKHVKPAQIAMAWVYCQKMNVFAVCSPSGKEHLEENILSSELSFTDREMDWLDLKCDKL